MKPYTDKQAIDELMQQIDDIDAVRKMPRMSAKFKSWQSNTSNLVGNIFGRKSKPAKDFDNIVFGLASFSNQTPESKFDEVFQQGLMNAAVVLSSIVKDIQKNGLDKTATKNSTSSALKKEPEPKRATGNSSNPIPSTTTPKPEPILTQAITPQPTTVAMGNKLFVLCAEENDIKIELENFLGKLGLVPVIIQEKVRQHVKLLDKLKEQANVKFAIVLIDPAANSLTHDAIFELGILVGRLGGNRVCCLSETNLNIVANYSGISYISADQAGAWKFMMIKQLKLAGFEVDANLAL